MLGLTPDQMEGIFTAAWVGCELLSCAVALWLYSKRYTLQGFVKRIRCHL